MPIYVYECQKCKKSVEHIERIDSTTKHKCPKCKKMMKRIIGNTSFHLKGGGWSADGYQNLSLDDTIKEAQNTKVG